MEKISKVDSLLANKLPTVATTSGHVRPRKIERFLLASKVNGKITQTALESVKESSQTLMIEYLENIRNALERKLCENDPGFELDDEMKRSL